MRKLTNDVNTGVTSRTWDVRTNDELSAQARDQDDFGDELGIAIAAGRDHRPMIARGELLCKTAVCLCSNIAACTAKHSALAC